jgi:ribonuclease P protein component
VLYWPSGLDHARLGMTTSAKRLRTAVSRNRVRRIVRESFRHSGARLAGFDIVVMAREATAGAGSGEIFASLDQHWDRVGRTVTDSRTRADD